MKSGTVAERLDLTGAQTDTHLDTPGLADLGKTVTSDTLTGSQNDLLLALNLVSLELPAGGVLRQYEVIGDKDNEAVCRLFTTVGKFASCLMKPAFPNRENSRHQERYHPSECAPYP